MAQKKTVLSVVKSKPVPPVVRDATGLIASAVASIVKVHGIGPAQAADALRRAATDAAFDASVKDVWQALHGTRPALVATRVEVPSRKVTHAKPGVAKASKRGNAQARKRA